MKLGFNLNNAVQVVVVVLVTVTLHFSSGCNITNVAYANNTPDSLSLTWDLTPDCLSMDFQNFRITALHRKFLACNEETNNSITTFDTREHSITLRNLHPFSQYKIGIVAQGSRNPVTTIESTLEVTTPPGIPKFRPRRSDQFNLALVQAIKFYWAVPDQETCRERNGRPSGYKWVSKSDWVSKKASFIIHIQKANSLIVCRFDYIRTVKLVKTSDIKKKNRITVPNRTWKAGTSIHGENFFNKSPAKTKGRLYLILGINKTGFNFLQYFFNMSIFSFFQNWALGWWPVGL